MTFVCRQKASGIAARGQAFRTGRFAGRGAGHAAIAAQVFARPRRRWSVHLSQAVGGAGQDGRGRGGGQAGGQGGCGHGTGPGRLRLPRPSPRTPRSVCDRGHMPGSEDVEDVEQDDDDDRNAEQPGDDAFHGVSPLDFPGRERGGAGFREVGRARHSGSGRCAMMRTLRMRSAWRGEPRPTGIVENQRIDRKRSGGAFLRSDCRSAQARRQGAWSAGGTLPIRPRLPGRAR